MKELDDIEANQLINSFMGAVDVTFDTWDELIPVVEKINQMNILEMSESAGIQKMRVKSSLYGIGVGDMTKEKVFNEIVKFIHYEKTM